MALKCAESDCKNKVNLENGTPIRTGCRSWDWAYPCEKCGRLHFLSGMDENQPPSCFGVTNRSEERAFLIDGEVVNKPPVEA